MSSDTRTRPEEAREPATQEPEESLDLTPVELLLRVYRFFYNKRVGLVLILAMVVMTLLGVLFQQVPDDIRADPQAYASWLDSVRPRYRGWTDPLGWLGIFSIFSSIPFKVVTVLLAISILACSIHRTPLLWRQATRPHTHVKESFFDHGRLHRTVDLPVSAGVAKQRVSEFLAGQRYRIVEDDNGPGENLYGDRFRFAPFGTVLAHLAFVVILAGVLVTSVAGFNNPGFTVTVGSKAEVGHGTDLVVEARSFTDSYYPDGRPSDYVSELVLYHQGQQVAQQAVRVNTPLRWGGVSFNQSYFGVAAELTVKDPSGRVLHAGGVPLERQTDDGKNAYGRITLPEQQLIVYVITAASGQVDPQIGPGQVRVEIYRDGQDQPLGAQVLSQGQPMNVAGLNYTFEREQQFTGLIVSRDPGAPLVWAGSALIVLGTCLTMFFRHRRVWVRVHQTPGGSQVRLASPDRADSSFEATFDEFVDALTTSESKRPAKGEPDA